MKQLIAVAAIALSTVVSTSAVEIDSHLEKWLNQKEPANQLTPSTIEVVVFFKNDEFKDQTGNLRSFAIANQARSTATNLMIKQRNLEVQMSSFSSHQRNFWASNAMLLNLDRRSLRNLTRARDVEKVFFNYPVTLENPFKSDEKAPEREFTYGLDLMRVSEAWSQGIDGTGVVVGIIDSGIDLDHPDLEGRVIAQKDFTKDGFTDDRNGHGTHVAGTIAGGDSSGSHIGVAPGVSLVIAKIFDDKGSSDLATILAAMEWMLNPDGDPNTDDAPRVVNNSWGSSSQFVLSFANIVKTWRRFGIFPSFAAGNSGPGWMSTGAPARYPMAYAVAAVGPNTKVTSFSSRGPSFWLKAWGTAGDEKLSWWQKWWPTLYTKPDIAAPGLDVYSSLPGGIYGRYSGTSMATPHVTGAIALAYQANPNLNIEEMEEILRATAKDLGAAGKDNNYGHGLLQADRLVSQALSRRKTSTSYFVDQDLSQENWLVP